MYNFQNFDSKIADSVERLASDLRSIQTGRATPMVLDNVMIDAYGSKMLVSHLASVGIEDAKTLRVTPFDKSVLKDLEQGINNANLGLSVASDSDGLRVIFPMLTTERRVQYVKLAKERYEDAKVKIKLSREDSKKDIEAKSKLCFLLGLVQKSLAFQFSGLLEKIGRASCRERVLMPV